MKRIEMKSMGYSPLENFSSYSLLKSTNTVPEMLKEGKARGYSAMALTDENVMYGAVAFYKEAKRQGIKPIIGLSANLFLDEDEQTPLTVVLLAKDQTGYCNLMKISTALNTGNQKTPLKTILPNLKHQFVIFSSRNLMEQKLIDGDTHSIENAIKEMQKNADSGAVKLGISSKQNRLLLDNSKKLAAKAGINLVAMNPVKYLNKDDYFANRVLEAIGAGSVLQNPIEEQHQVGTEFLETAQEAENSFQKVDLKQAVFNNQQIVNSIDVKIPLEAPKLPKFKTPGRESSKDFLRGLCEKGLKERGLTSGNYQARLNQELKIIDEMGFNDYFLIVWDVLNFAHQNGIVTGPGRGSAAGSLVSYALRITDVDPIKYNLLFERFLNPERAQMPDIDIDIPDNRRDDILKYIHDKYGDAHVSQIVTFGTLAAKQSIRDVGRVFGMKPDQMAKWSSAIPNHLHESLAKAESESQKLADLLSENRVNQLLFETAKKLEGLPRHFSTHAAGLILSEDPIVDRSPLQDGNDELKMTQYSKYYVEGVGLLKIDFLGLRNLSILANILDTIHEQIDPQFSINQISLNDQKTLRLFQQGMTNGVFQFESTGIKSVLRKLKPDSFQLVAAVNALYRPGPIKNIDTFIARKNGKEKVHYPNQAIKKILSPTFGIIVYQEQVMQLASTMAGFSLGEADILRRAMSKKHKNEMEKLKSKFVSGSIANGYSKKEAENTYDYIERFSNYGFNKSHAVAYSKMAFELAYLKAHYPGPFFNALLNSVLGNSFKIKTYVHEAKQMKIEFLPPDINESKAEFIFTDNKIRFGFNAIKGMRTDFISALLTEREKGGKFKNLGDLVRRMGPRFAKEDTLTDLVNVGALDSFGYNRRELITAIPEFISSAKLSGNSVELLKALTPTVKRLDDYSDWEKLNRENELLGTYLSGHPVEHYAKLAEQKRAKNALQAKPGDKRVNMVLFVSHIKTIRTKKGQLMAFIDGNDQFGNIDITVFPKQYARISPWLKTEMVVLVTGKVEQNRGLQIVADSVEPAANVSRKITKQKKEKLFLRITKEVDSEETSQRLARILKENPGSSQVILFRVKDDKKTILNPKFNVAINGKMRHDLKGLLGDKNVVVQ